MRSSYGDVLFDDARSDNAQFIPKLCKSVKIMQKNYKHYELELYFAERIAGSCCFRPFVNAIRCLMSRGL